MKAFRGTAIAALLLAIVAAIVWWARPEVFSGVTEGAHPKIFSFEKHDMVRVDVLRPDGTQVSLVEQDGRWLIAGTDHPAGRSMVNRVKHQIHGLTARATVVADPKTPELYGLGENAIEVKLTLKSGEVIRFRAGDPNPSGVSYYLQPEGSDVIYTVQKAAVDYYSLTLDEFRERRFSGFDSKDVTRITAVLDLPEATHTLDIEKTGDRSWEQRSPLQIAASDDQVRRLLGRVSALKAREFIPLEGKALGDYGLDSPRADITIHFGSRDPLRVRVGADASSASRHEQLAYVLLDGVDTIFVARSGLLKAYGIDPTALRNRRVVRMRSADVISIDGELMERPDDNLHGTGSVRYAAEQWVWKDGVPVAGSTPKRVARRLAELEVAEFVDDAPGRLARYGLDKPLARVVLKDRHDNERIVLIGDEGEPLLDRDGNERSRRFLSIEGQDPVYLADAGVLSVVRDLVRESGRKRDRDAEKAARLERIETKLEETE
jgi:hypothetical protein